VIYYDFTKKMSEINKKEKDKTVFKTAHNHVKNVICTVSKVEGCILPGFEVEGPKVDFFLERNTLYHRVIKCTFFFLFYFFAK
jgi:hypothetical protein